MSGGILPQKSCLEKATILPKQVGAYDIKGNESRPGMIVLGAVLIMAALIFGGSYYSFQHRFENEWSRVESLDDSYYELKLDIHQGEIEYIFDSWAITETIATYDYTIVFPGKIVINGDWDDIYSVEVKDGLMKIKPALTSSDASEYWFD